MSSKLFTLYLGYTQGIRSRSLEGQHFSLELYYNLHTDRLYGHLPYGQLGALTSAAGSFKIKIIAKTFLTPKKQVNKKMFPYESPY